MQYDPIKRTLGKVFNTRPTMRVIFYKLLDLLLLRSWHIRRALFRWNIERKGVKADILDAGCGFGQYSHRMAELNDSNVVTGVDVKSEQIADCNEFFDLIGLGKRVHFEEADLTKFVRPDSYDLILSVDVMEHILEDETVFGNFHQSLRKGGVLLISTPSDQGGSDADEHSHEHEGGTACDADVTIHGFIDEHVRDGYNINDIQDKLRKAGFSNVEATYTYGTPGHISWILSMKWPITILNVSKIFFLLLPFYYLATYPFCLLLNALDVFCSHSKGTGLMVKAYKE